MTRLFRVEEDGSMVEVDSTERLAGIYDAILIAERTGDGKYVYDHQNGQYQELAIAGGRAQEFAPDSVKYGTPGQDTDKLTMADTVANSVSTVGGTFFPSDGVVGQPLDTTVSAVEEF